MSTTALSDVPQALRLFCLPSFDPYLFCTVSVTIVSAILMFILFVSEFNYYLTTEVAPELFVDTTRGQKLRINVDITFPRLACACKFVLNCTL